MSAGTILDRPGEEQGAGPGDARHIGQRAVGAVRGDRWARIAVWGVLACMTLVVLGHIALYGQNVPLAEDWELVRPLVGQEPDLWAWVWSQNNEHRLPVARLILLGLLRLTGDFRAGMVLDTLLLAALAGGCVLLARRLRGRASLVDAFFPVVLLHLGHWENLVWSWQLQLVLVAAAVGALVLLYAGSAVPVRPRTALLLAGVVLLLSLGGGTALPLLPAALAGLGALVWLPRASRRSRGIALGGAVLTVLSVGLYFVGWESAPWYPDNPGVRPTLRVTAMVLALAWGPAAERAFPLAMAGTAVVLGATAVVLVRAVLRAGAQRGRAAALLCVLAGVGLTALAVSYGRAGLVGSEGLPDRYVITTVPALLVIWFAWQLFGSPRARRAVQAGLLAVAVLLLPLNTAAGYAWRDWYTSGMDAVEQDLRDGAPVDVMVARHGEFLMHWDDETLAARMVLLRDAGIGPFAALRDEPVPAG